MSLLSDLQEDLISDALSAPAAKKPRNEWREPTSWTHTGYLARCQSLRCPSCQKTTETGLGIFAEESASNGTRRLTRVRDWPQGATNRMELVESSMPGPCFDCMVAFGFAEVVDAPSIPTNIAGEGMMTTPSFRTSLNFSRRAGDE